MASMLTGITLVLALVLAAAAGIALLVGLFRVSARRPADGMANHSPNSAGPPARVS